MHCPNLKNGLQLLFHFQIHALARSDQKLNSHVRLQSVEHISCWIPLNLFHARLDQGFNYVIQFMCMRFGFISCPRSVNALVSPDNCPLARALGEIQDAIPVGALGDSKAIVGQGAIMWE